MHRKGNHTIRTVVLSHRHVAALKPWSKPFAVAGALVLASLLAAVDYLTGIEVSFALFYVVPVTLAAWVAGAKAGIVVSVFAAVAWQVANRLAGETFSSALIPYWNAFSRLAVLLVVALLLAKLKAVLERERALSRVDSLTRVANPRAFHETAAGELARARRHGRPITVLFVDVDDFKRVNDRFGHQGGDAVLRTVAGVLARSVRDTDCVARLGGDEFVVLFPETACEAAAAAIKHLQAELLREMQRKRWPVTFSMGAHTFSSPPQAVEALVRAADELMYGAKQNGRNRLEHRCS
jgi:diguanylate cyclase (GGDEF)-like protein